MLKDASCTSGLCSFSRSVDTSFHTEQVNPFLPTVPTFAVRETDVSRHNGGTSGAPLKLLRDDSALRALSSLRGLRGAPAVTPLCRETQSLGQQMLKATVGINGLKQEENANVSQLC